MTPSDSIVFLVDVDNTLLDNDNVKKDIEAKMLEMLGDEVAAGFWHHYETVRKDLDVIDFFETMKRVRTDFPNDTERVDAATAVLMTWDFRSRVYPRALEVLDHLKTMGTPIVTSDGDPVFQPRKIHQSGVTPAVDGRVLIFVHKEHYIPAIVAAYPAERYVLIEDKPGILMRSKKWLGDRLTTVHVLQGKYALDPKHAVDYKPDIVVENIADLLKLGAADFATAAKTAAATTA